MLSKAKTTPDWSCSLRHDDNDISGDDAGPRSPSTSRSAQAGSWGDRDDDDGFAWGSTTDFVDIGMVDEPASLKFVETPFTMAKRAGATSGKAAKSVAKPKEKGKARRPPPPAKAQPAPSPASLPRQSTVQSASKAGLAAAASSKTPAKAKTTSTFKPLQPFSAAPVAPRAPAAPSPAHKTIPPSSPTKQLKRIVAPDQPPQPSKPPLRLKVALGTTAAKHAFFGHASEQVFRIFGFSRLFLFFCSPHRISWSGTVATKRRFAETNPTQASADLPSPGPAHSSGEVSHETRARLDRFRYIGNSGATSQTSSPASAYHSESATKRSRDAASENIIASTATRGSSTSSPTTARFTLPGFSPSSGPKRPFNRLAFEPAEPLSSFQARMSSSSSRSSFAGSYARDDSEGREKVILGAAVRSVKPILSTRFGGSVSGVAGKQRKVERGVSLVVPRDRGVQDEKEESAEARLRRLYRSLER
ncbi:hypothetical protein Rt10032_c12g4886 [Rhodotorula toruloides]|uniref:Uncharacterized protein n=1 Tax=Rhodotorula toruloides TaxID=5286 RepID=A0A511KKF8_RHOTO|nr:hypothetical protein Rt10032_c12g4886 [Rhodotorula toruloides]